NFEMLTKELEFMYNVNNELNTEKEKLEQNVNLLKENNSRLGEQLENKGRQYSELHKKNQELKDEASQYLGDTHELKTVVNERNILKNNCELLTKELEFMYHVNNELNTEKAKLEQNVNLLKENNSRLGEQLENK